MLVKVAPIRRMPRKLGAYDYSVPEDLTVQVGSFVSVPFRRSIVVGVVVAIIDESEFDKVLDIKDVLDIPAFSEADVRFYEALALHLYESIGSILYAAVPVKPARRMAFKPVEALKLRFSVSKEEASLMKKIVNSIKLDFCNICVPSDRISIGAILGLLKRSDSPVMVIVPDVHMMHEVAGALRGIVDDVFMYGGSMNKTTAFELWKRIRSGYFRVVVATRIGGLVIPSPDTRVVVLASGEDDHCQKDQRPHYDVRWCLLRRRESHANKLVFMGTYPRLEDGALTTDLWRFPGARVVDMNGMEKIHEHYYLSDALIQSIEAADLSKGAYLIYFNRKGDSRMMICDDCGSSAVCGQCERPLGVVDGGLVCYPCQRNLDMPKVCPTCQSHNLGTRGFGNRRLAGLFERRFPGVGVRVVEAQEDIPDSGICIVTRRIIYALDLIRPQISGLAIIRAEQECVMRGFRSVEQATRLIRRLSSFASSARVDCIIQTWTPGLIQDSLGDTRELYEEDLRVRKILGYPPFKCIIVATEDEKRVFKVPCDSVVDELLTMSPKCDILVNPY